MATRKPRFNKLTKPKKRGKQWLVDNGYALQGANEQPTFKNNNYDRIFISRSWNLWRAFTPTFT